MNRRNFIEKLKDWAIFLWFGWLWVLSSQAVAKNQKALVATGALGEEWATNVLKTNAITINDVQGHPNYNAATNTLDLSASWLSDQFILDLSNNYTPYALKVKLWTKNSNLLPTGGAFLKIQGNPAWDKSIVVNINLINTGPDTDGLNPVYWVELANSIKYRLTFSWWWKAPAVLDTEDSRRILWYISDSTTGTIYFDAENPPVGIRYDAACGMLNGTPTASAWVLTEANMWSTNSDPWSDCFWVTPNFRNIWTFRPANISMLAIKRWNITKNWKLISIEGTLEWTNTEKVEVQYLSGTQRVSKKSFELKNGTYSYEAPMPWSYRRVATNNDGTTNESNIATIDKKEFWAMSEVKINNGQLSISEPNGIKIEKVAITTTTWQTIANATVQNWQATIPHLNDWMYIFSVSTEKQIHRIKVTIVNWQYNNHIELAE